MSKRKRIKLRRTFPKRFASDNIQGKSNGVSKVRIPPAYEGIADYRQRGKSLDFSTFEDYKYTKEEINKFNSLPLIPVSIKNGPVIVKKTGREILEAQDQSPPRFRVLELLENKLISSHGFNDFKYFIVLYELGETTLKLFHSGAKRCFVKEIGDKAIRSRIYDTNQDAMNALHSAKGIYWLEAIKT